jgi:small-conductance mechanosensitive channel
MRLRTALALSLAILAALFLIYKYAHEKSLLDLKNATLAVLPKILTAFLVIFLAHILWHVTKPLISRLLQRLEQRHAILATLSLLVNLLAVLVALSVLVGSVSTFITSLGLIGLGITWTLQTPILCFTGWILINIRGYYRIGDRIKVNDIYGDVAQIDFLTTTVWEYGSTWFIAEQPSGRMITIPNSLVLQTAVFNYTKDFPYVWDELVVSMAYESDLSHTKEIVLKAAREVIGDSMVKPIHQYREILKRSNLDYGISEEPEIFMTFADSWANLHLRYLVPAREKRGTKTAISEHIFKEFNKPENTDKIKPIYPRIQHQAIDSSGTVAD